MIINEKHKEIINNTDNGDWIYIGSYEVDEIMINGLKRKARKPYCLVEHKYCHTLSAIRPDVFKTTTLRPKCCCRQYENSFAYFIEYELKINIEQIWDFQKNEVNPYYIYRNSSKKVWLKCMNTNYHPSNLYMCDQFIRMTQDKKTKGLPCPYCSHKGKNKIHHLDSFAQWGMDNIGEHFLQEYWDYDKNTINPYEIYKGTDIKVWIKCNECNQSYYIRCANFTFGYRCNICNKSKGERVIRDFLNNYNIDFIPQKTFKDLIGLGNGYLSYDFYLPKYNLLIEYQGIQHETDIEYFGGIQSYERQRQHDIMKRNYAIKQHIQLLEIWYWDYDNIENILEGVLDI